MGEKLPAACCDEWTIATTENGGLVGGGLYPRSSALVGQIEASDDGTWSINGCCGGCFVVTNVKFCPFCGADRRFSCT